jgi:hypothetical protein
MESILGQNRGNFATAPKFHKVLLEGVHCWSVRIGERWMNGIELDIRSAGIFWSSGQSDSAISSWDRDQGDAAGFLICLPRIFSTNPLSINAPFVRLVVPGQFISSCWTRILLNKTIVSIVSPSLTSLQSPAYLRKLSLRGKISRTIRGLL